MSKERKPKDRPASAGQGGAEPTAGPAMWLRVVISLVLLWHLFVVFISPLAVEPASILVSRLAYSDYVRWYSDSLYLNHGYHFFGPDPPTNLLVRYRVADDTGATAAEGEFPNTEQQWPRLLYHRHMMLADQSAIGPGDTSPEAWREIKLRAYARRLLRLHEGARVRVDCVRHLPLSPYQAMEGVDPDSPEFFQTVASVEETAAALEQPLAVPAPPQPEQHAGEFELLPLGGGL